MNERIICYTGLKTVLRPINPEKDLPYCLKWVNDETVNRFVKAVSPVSEYKERQFLESIGTKDTDIVYGIETLEGKFIGMMGIHNIKWISRTATTGALIGDKNYWGNGYGTDAKMLLLHHAFHRLNLRRIGSSVIAYNKRSAAYLKKTGYKKEGLLKDVYFRDGKYWDQIVFRIFQEDFEPLWSEYSKKLIINQKSKL